MEQSQQENEEEIRVSSERAPSQKQIHFNDEVGVNRIYPEKSEKKKHPRKVYVISMCATIGGLLFGYDTGIINGALLVIEKDYELTNFWRESIVTATVFAAAVFSITAGVIADAIGRKITIMIAAGVFTLGGIIMAFAPTLEFIFIGRFVVGAGIGWVSCIVPVYVSECAPKEIRGQLITINQLFITIGIVISSILAGALQELKYGWRIMLGLGAVPGAIQLLIFFKLPETPRYLVMKDNLAQAKEVLKSIRNYEQDDFLEELKEIKESVDADKEQKGWKIWKSVLTTPHIRKALLVGCGLQFFQQLCGINTVISEQLRNRAVQELEVGSLWALPAVGTYRYYSATILKSSGFSATKAVWLSTIPATVNFLCTFPGLWAVETLGRRKVLAVSFLAIAASCGVLSIGFIMGSKTAPSAYPYGDKGSYGECGQHENCESCIRLSNEQCGFCHTDKDETGKMASCVELSRDIEDHMKYAKLGRCARNSTEAHKTTLMYEYCPNNYAVLPLLGLILFVASFAPGAGPMPWTINAEIYPTWARSVANSIATLTNWTFNVVVSFSFMTLVRNLQAYGTFFLFLNVCIVAAIFTMGAVPETRGLTLEEIEYLFMTKEARREQKRKAKLLKHAL